MNKKWMKLLAQPLLLVAIGGTLAGCNTVAGLGKDIERVGDKIENAAKK